VHNQEDDILLIRKYLSGELDTRAMHELERRALDDPFLKDALEGYEYAGGYQPEDIADLTNRLNGRTGVRRTKVISMRWMGVAASILIICSAGGWWLYQTSQAGHVRVVQPAGTAEKAQQNPVEKKSQTATDTAGKAAKLVLTETGKKDELAKAAAPYVKKVRNSKPAGQIVADESVKMVQPQPLAAAKLKEQPKADTTPLDEMIVMQYNAKKKTDSSVSLRKTAKVRPAIKPPTQLLEGQAPGVNIYSSGQSNNDQSSMITQGYVPLSNVQVNRIIEGRVIAKDDGRPIAGASVNVEGTDKTTQTDGEGRFWIKADSIHARLVVAGIGYATRMVSANSRDSVNNISLDPRSSTLAEVVATSNIPKDLADSTLSPDTIKAHPVPGWTRYNAYLQQNAVSPDGKTGVVKLSFMVDQYGSISNLMVTKSLSEACDKKAIALVKSGPSWTGRADKKPGKIRLRVRFIKSP
jgi:hypothetical protein